VSSGGQTFDLYAGGVYAGRVGITIPGRHNIRNALAAVAAAAQGYGAKLSTLISALGTFQGVRRRQDLLYEERGVRVYDDFAHHPTAVDETLRALRAKHPEGTLWAVFEPRSATACRALHQDEYARAFGAANRVVFAPLGRSEIAVSERLDLQALVTTLSAAGTRATAAPSVEAIVDLISSEAKAGDTVLLMSNGAFGGIYDKLRGALAR
jgi:UDP-N-acetylmuramate: L-alanyl-gamma-D-glutamyl-meso-diaminopimelate ligase